MSTSGTRPGTQQVSGPVVPSTFFTQNSHEHELDPHSQSLVFFLHSPNKQGKNETSGEEVAEEFLETMERHLNSRIGRLAVSLVIDNRRISFADVRSSVSL